MVVKDTHKDRIEDNNGNTSSESDSDHITDNANINGMENRNGTDSRNGADREHNAITARLESRNEQEEEHSDQEPEAVDLIR